MSTATPSVDPRAPSADAVAALRLLEAPSHWTSRLVDRLNPIFVKETRQALKSRQFLGAFFAVLLLSWLISATAVITGGAQLEYTQAGRGLFAAYFVVLAGAILVVVPFGTFRSLLSEREESTFEPLIISALTPRQIVLGKLYSALLQTFLFYSAIAPFIAFTALLQGFDIANVALTLSLGLLGSLGASIAALAVSSMIKGRVWQTIVSLAVLGGLVTAFSGAWGMVLAIDYVVDWSNPWFVWGLAVWVLAGLSYVVLLQQVAVSNLTFAADNRSTGLRLICEGQFLLLWFGIGLSAWWLSSTASYFGIDQMAVGGIVLSLVHWAACGLFFVTEVDELSQRIARRLPRSAWLRLLLAPLYPGGSRGLLFVLLNIAAVAGLVFAQTSWFGKSVGEDDVVIPLVLCLYLVIYLNVGAALTRWGMAFSPAIQPIHGRVGTLLTVALSMIAPLFVMAFEPHYTARDYSVLYVTNPGLTVEYLDRNSALLPEILIVLGVACVLTLLVNLPSIARGVREMVRANPDAPMRVHE